MNIDYYKETKVNDSLYIESIGNCFIQANNDNASSWFLRINTVMGMSEVTWYGPVDLSFSPIGELLDQYTIYYEKTPYQEKKLVSMIDKFLNDKSRKITQALEIDKEEFSKHLLRVE